MTLDDFVLQLREVTDASREKLYQASLDRRFREIPVPELQRLYEKYRNVNFNLPNDPYELVMVTFSFVELDVIHRMKNLYFGSLARPDQWPDVVSRCTADVQDLESGVIGDMESAVSRAHI